MSQNREYPEPSTEYVKMGFGDKFSASVKPRLPEEIEKKGTSEMGKLFLKNNATDEEFINRKDDSLGTTLLHTVNNEVEELPSGQDMRYFRNQRHPMLEMKQASQLQKRETEAIRQIIDAEVTEFCKPEVDNYVECVNTKMFAFRSCRDIALEMRRCMKKYENTDYISRRYKEIANERQKTGTGQFDQNMMAMANKLFIPTSYDKEKHQL